MTNNLGPAGIRAPKAIMPLAATSEATSGARLSFGNGLERYELLIIATAGVDSLTITTH